jgi:uncharacterized membrane protein YjfL (UPF0719 family)
MLFAMSERLENIIDGLGETLPLLGISLVLLLVYRIVHDRITRFDDSEQVSRGNAAVAVSRGGAYLGILVAQLGTFVLNDVDNFGERLRNHAINGAVALVVFTAATYVIDWFVLRKANNQDDLAAGNLSVAAVEFGSYVSLGAIMAAAFGGDDPGVSFAIGLLNAVVFSFVGLFSLMLVYTAYVKLWQVRTKVHIDSEIDNHNVAAGIDAGSLLLSVGFVLACSIAGDHVSWSDDLITYGLAAVVAVVSITIARAATLLFLPSVLRTAGGHNGTVHHENVAQSFIVALASIGFSAIIGAAIVV